MIYHRRYLHDILASGASDNKIRMVFGARQTGKTVLLKELVSEHHTIIYNLQDVKVRQRLEKDPAILSRELDALTPDEATHVLIDEIQKVPALLDELQFIYDKDKTRFQFFVTGSSARKLRHHSSNLLPGRSHVFHLFPVSFIEEEKRKHKIIDFPSFQSKSLFPTQTLDRRLAFGNLPGVREESNQAAMMTLDGYVSNYLEEEIRKESIVKNMSSFHIFLELAAQESGNQVNMSKISQESSIPVSTIKNYYQVLADTFIGFWVHPFKKRARKRLMTTPEFFLFDTGVANAAANYNPQRKTPPEIAGRLMENLVAIELYQRCHYLGRGYDLFFWRTVSGAEVDFILETPMEDIPIEVKWTDSPQVKHAKNIEKFIELHPERAKRGFVVCQTPCPQKLTKNVLAINVADM